LFRLVLLNVLPNIVAVVLQDPYLVLLQSAIFIDFSSKDCTSTLWGNNYSLFVAHPLMCRPRLPLTFHRAIKYLLATATLSPKALRLTLATTLLSKKKQQKIAHDGTLFAFLLVHHRLPACCISVAVQGLPRFPYGLAFA
jgi:hypothetical protein